MAWHLLYLQLDSNDCGCILRFHILGLVKCIHTFTPAQDEAHIWPYCIFFSRVYAMLMIVHIKVEEAKVAKLLMYLPGKSEVVASLPSYSEPA